MSGSRTITADDLLDDIHPGDILHESFLIGSEVALAEVAEGAKIDPVITAELVASRRNVDASSDARLTPLFRHVRRLFLRLQNSYDMEEWRATTRRPSPASSAAPPDAGECHKVRLRATR